MKKTQVKNDRKGLRKHLKIKCVSLLCICMMLFQAFSIQAQANILVAKISLNMKNVPLKSVLQEIEEQTDYSFYYNENQINARKIVSIDAEELEVQAVLDKLLSDCQYVVENKQIILIPQPGNNPTQPRTKQQESFVTGTITDTSGEPLIGASVAIEGTTYGTITDIDGNFSLSVPNNNVTLIVSYIGYKEKVVALEGKTSIHIMLEDDQQLLDEVVVIGYGTQKKKDLTGGIVTISAEKFEKVPAPNLAKRLQGQMAGMNIVVKADPTADFETNQNETIRIRGEKSLNGGNAPLIVLDGIPFSGQLNQIDQNSVENISVLKDASAAAIYGARAANGVILITTKKGQQGKPQVRYNGYVAVQTPERLLNLMKGNENIEMLKQYNRDIGNANWEDPLDFLPTLPRENYLAGNEFDWQKELFSPAVQHEHQVSLSGGTDRNNYYASLSYTDQQGMVQNTGIEKFAATVNMSQKIGSWLTIGMNTQLNQRQNSGIRPEYDQAFYLSPWSDPYNEDGSYNHYPMYTTIYWKNPYQNIDGVLDNKVRSVFTAWYADILLPVKGLSYRTNFGYTYRDIEKGTYYGKTTLKGEPLDGIAKIENTSYSDWTWENIIRYDRNFGLHHLDVTGMISAQKTHNMKSTMEAQGFLNDENAYFNIGVAQSDKKTLTSNKAETALASYMGRINYNYASRYLLTLTARYDGYSAFGANNKWAFFPSVAGGWVLTEERFFQDWDIRALDYLKFRVSYGANGNQAISAYQTLTKMSQYDYIYGDGSSFAGGLLNSDEVGNPNLKWETTYTFNFGLDFSLFNSRLAGNLEIYSAITKDLLMNRSVPIMNGYLKMMDNVGKTQTKGFELTLNSLNIQKKDFQWSTSLAFAGNWNKIKELREDGEDDVSNKWFIGKPISVHYDYKVTGTWQTGDADLNKYGASPGDAKLQDTDNDGSITSDDRVIIGSKLPVWTAGLTNTFSYKNWALSVFLNGVFDITKENVALKFQAWQLDKAGNYLSGVKYWTPENGSNEATRLGYTPKNAHNFYSDASYVRIQDITLSYDFNQKVTDLLRIQRLGLYASVNNLCTFAKANKYGMNIEETSIGSPSNSFPIARSFVFGVNVTF